LHAHSIEANLALLHQVIENAKDLWHVIDLRRRAMELEEVECLCLQIVQAAFDKAAQILTVIATGCMGIEPPPCLGGNDDLLTACLAHLGNQLLRVTIAIDICCIDKVDPQIDSSVKCS